MPLFRAIFIYNVCSGFLTEGCLICALWFRIRKEVPRFHFTCIALISSCMVNISSHSNSFLDLKDDQPPIKRASWHVNLLCNWHQLWTLLTKKKVCMKYLQHLPPHWISQKVTRSFTMNSCSHQSTHLFTRWFHKIQGFNKNRTASLIFLPRIYSRPLWPITNQ